MPQTIDPVKDIVDITELLADETIGQELYEQASKYIDEWMMRSSISFIEDAEPFGMNWRAAKVDLIVNLYNILNKDWTRTL